jgi:hypothetical protein
LAEAQWQLLVDMVEVLRKDSLDLTRGPDENPSTRPPSTGHRIE